MLYNIKISADLTLFNVRSFIKAALAGTNVYIAYVMYMTYASYDLCFICDECIRHINHSNHISIPALSGAHGSLPL